MGEESNRVSLVELFFIRLVCENLTIFNPTNIIAGDGLKGVFLKKNGITYQTAFTSVLLSRILLIVSAILLMIIAMVYLFVKVTGGMISGPSLVMFIVLGLIFSVGMILILVSPKMYLVALTNKLGKTWIGKWIAPKRKEEIREINHNLVNYYRSSKLRLLGALFFSGMHWVFGALEIYIILVFFGVEISAIDALAIEMGVIGFKTMASIIPGQIGVEEYANKVMLGLVGIVSNEIWLIVSLLRRLRQLFWLGLSAVTSVFLYKKYKITESSS